MMTRTLTSLLSMLLLVGMAALPTAVSDQEETVALSGVDALVAEGPGSAPVSDSNHEARCGGIAPLETCQDMVFLPLGTQTVSMGAALTPGFTGTVVITLSTPPDPSYFFYEVTCEIFLAYVGPAACQITGGNGLFPGQWMTMQVDFTQTTVGGYEFWATVQ